LVCVHLLVFGAIEQRRGLGKHGDDGQYLVTRYCQH
jgi:hypothetical protein